MSTLDGFLAIAATPEMIRIRKKKAKPIITVKKRDAKSSEDAMIKALKDGDLSTSALAEITGLSTPGVVRVGVRLLSKNIVTVRKEPHPVRGRERNVYSLSGLVHA